MIINKDENKECRAMLVSLEEYNKLKVYEKIVNELKGYSAFGHLIYCLEKRFSEKEQGNTDD